MYGISQTKRQTKWCFIVLTAMLAGALPVPAQSNNAAPADDKTLASAAATNLQDTLRSYLQIQEQIYNTQLAIEKYRAEARAATSNSLAVEERLHLMEQDVAAQRTEQTRGFERADRQILIASGTFAAIGFLVLLLAAFLQWNAFQRLATVMSAPRAFPGLNPPPEESMPVAYALDQANTRFLGLIERLEERIHGLEKTAQGPSVAASPALPPAQDQTPSLPFVPPLPLAPLPAPIDVTTAAPEKDVNPVGLLIAKSQTLMKLDQPEQALQSLDEALVLNPGNADALVKKGAALERLQRFDEAILCYDLAIAQDESLTMAYLYKGSLSNRMERYNDALACYEKALKKPAKGSVESKSEPHLV